MSVPFTVVIFVVCELGHQRQCSRKQPLRPSEVLTLCCSQCFSALPLLLVLIACASVYNVIVFCALWIIFRLNVFCLFWWTM